jgi:hypothetical protein
VLPAPRVVVATVCSQAILASPGHPGLASAGVQGLQFVELGGMAGLFYTAARFLRWTKFTALSERPDMVEDGRVPPGPPVLHPDPRCELLILVLMASFVMRTMHRLRVAVSGGLDGVLVLLELLVAEREWRLRSAPEVAGRPPPPRRSITGLGFAIGVPRETVRRLLAGLAAAGWIEVTAAGGHLICPQARERFALCEGGSGFSEFVWVASQVQAVHAARGEAVEPLLVRQAWQRALASEWRNPPDRCYPELALGLLERLRRAEAPERERLAHPVDLFLCRHLKRLRRVFDSDLMLPLLIGEIAHRNVSSLVGPDGPGGPLRQFSLDPSLQAPETLAEYLRCNTYSLSLATGIPEATVRRKVARLAARGWVRIAADHSLAVEPRGVRARTGAMDAETLADMLEAYRTLCACGSET